MALERLPILIIATESKEFDPCCKARHIRGYVCCATWLLGHIYSAYHRYRSLGRYSLDIAPYIAVQHEVTDHEDLPFGLVLLQKLYDSVQHVNHREAPFFDCSSQMLSSTQSQSI